MSETQKHNWPQIIRELAGAGVGINQLKRLVGRQWGQVDRWRHGAEPRYSDAIKLLELYERYIK